ncbi:unnamed protein product, partial [Scytosiphon promiscuus]
RLITCIRPSGHEVRVSNLYDEKFQPVLWGEEHRGFLTAFRENRLEEDMKAHVDNLLWCSGLVLCYPTWWYSFPAILKVFM